MNEIVVKKIDIDFFNENKENNTLDLALESILENLSSVSREEAKQKGFTIQVGENRRINFSVPNPTDQLSEELTLIFQKFCYVVG